MRKIVVALTILLTLSGLLLGFSGVLGPPVGVVKWTSIGHIWVGFFFLVLFPLYAWDHIKTNRAWLRRAAPVTFSGVFQTAAAAVLILSGAVLYLYGDQVWHQVRQWHYWLTYLLVAALALHFLSPKHWR